MSHHLPPPPPPRQCIKCGKMWSSSGASQEVVQSLSTGGTLELNDLLPVCFVEEQKKLFHLVLTLQDILALSVFACVRHGWIHLILCLQHAQIWACHDTGCALLPQKERERENLNSKVLALNENT